MEYLISLKGYDSSEDMYLVEADLENCTDLLGEYKQTVGLALRRPCCDFTSIMYFEMVMLPDGPPLVCPW